MNAAWSPTEAHSDRRLTMETGLRRALERQELRLFYQPKVDAQSGAITALEALPFFTTMHRFLPALFRRDGWDVRSVEVSHRPRRGGRSHYGMFNRLWVGIVDMAGVWWLARRGVRTADRDEGRGTGDG